MSEPLVSVITSHYKRDKTLARLLRCLRRQTYRNMEIIIAADGSPPRQPFLWHGKSTYLWDLIARWNSTLNSPKIRWIAMERQANDLPRMAGCYNDAVHGYAQGEMLLLLLNDWWLEDAWVEKMVASLLPLGKKNHMVGIQKGRRHQVMGDWPYEACVAPLPLPGYVDCGAASLLWREDWTDQDEEFDPRCNLHSWPLWGEVMYFAAGQTLWYNSTLMMKHCHEAVPHTYGCTEVDPAAKEDFEWSDQLFQRKRIELLQGCYQVVRRNLENGSTMSSLGGSEIDVSCET